MNLPVMLLLCFLMSSVLIENLLQYVYFYESKRSKLNMSISNVTKRIVCRS